MLLEQDDDEEELEAAPPEADEVDEGPVVSATGVQKAKMRYCMRRGRWFGRGWQGAAGLTWFNSGGGEDGGTAASEVNCCCDEGGGTKAGRFALEGSNRDGLEEQSAASRGSWHAGGSQACKED